MSTISLFRCAEAYFLCSQLQHVRISCCDIPKRLHFNSDAFTCHHHISRNEHNINSIIKLYCIVNKYGGDRAREIGRERERGGEFLAKAILEMHHIDASAFQPVYRLVQIFIACDASELHLDERGKKNCALAMAKSFRHLIQRNVMLLLLLSAKVAMAIVRCLALDALSICVYSMAMQSYQLHIFH